MTFHNSHSNEEIIGHDQPGEQVFRIFTVTERVPKFQESMDVGTTLTGIFWEGQNWNSHTQVLPHYDVTAETKVCADVSIYILGAVLLQNKGKLWKQ